MSSFSTTVWKFQVSARSGRLLCVLNLSNPYFGTCFTFILYNVGRQDNILQRNLFVLLTSNEMVAQSRLLGIVYLSCMLPLRWLAGKTHTLAQYGWGARSMSRALNVFLAKLDQIHLNPLQFLSEMFMMNLFQEIMDDLPPFQEYWTHLFEKRRMNAVSRKSGARLMGLARAREELFFPTKKTNRECEPRLRILIPVFTACVRGEMRDKKKACWRNIDESDSVMCYKNCKDTIEALLLGHKAVNDDSERALGMTTRNVQRGNNVLLSNAAEEAGINFNNAFKRPLPVHGKEKGDRSQGIFHEFSPELIDAILIAGVENAPSTRVRNNEDLERQEASRLRKEEFAKRKGMEKAKKELVRAYMYYDMWKTEACWKGDPTVVAQKVRKLSTDNKKRDALKANISIRVKGFGWTDYHITWTHKRVKRIIRELSNHLRKIIREEAKKVVPLEPPANVLKRREMPVLGTMTDERRQLDEKHKGKVESLRKVVRMMEKERHERGDENSIYDAFQPFDMPILTSLVGERIDICWPLDKGEGADKTTCNEWCQGEVIEIVKMKPPTVRVMWDAMLDVEGFEACSEGECELDPEKWCKRSSWGWRKDIDVELIENYYDEDDVVVEEDDEEDIAYESSDEELDLGGETGEL